MLSEGAAWAQSTASEHPAPATHAPRDSSGVNTQSNNAKAAENSIDTSQPCDVSSTAATAGGSTSDEVGGLAGGADELHGGSELTTPQQGEAARGVCRQCCTKDQQLMEQRAQIADLDLQLRTMRADILRSTQLASQVGRVMLPALYSIESRLTDAVSDR